MILTRRDEALVLVTQGDHAHLAAQILALVRLPQLEEHPRRERLLRATREHDNGWREIDAAPPVDPTTGSPMGFRDLPGELRRELWWRGCLRWREDDPWVALLIALHALHLHTSRRGSAAWEEWLAAVEDLVAELAGEALTSIEDATTDHTWLRLADTWSLALCERDEQFFEGAGFRGRVRGTTLHLDPFPLVGRTSFAVPSRRLEPHHFAGTREAGLALARAAWSQTEVSVAPWPQT